MIFDTKDLSCLFPYGNRELFFLLNIHKETHLREYGSFDPALGIYSNIIETLLSLNEQKAIDFINSVEDEYHMQLVSSNFPRVSFKFQSEEFIKVIEEISNKFKISEYFEYIQENIAEAKRVINK